MACSRERVAKSSIRVVHVLSSVFSLLLLLVAMNTVPAFAASSTADRVVEPVTVQRVSVTAFGIEMADDAEDGSMMLSVPRLCPVVLSSVCDPAVIEAGVDCGMDWMCGIEPCLCGSADAWGGCSCNGLEELEPTVAYTSSDEGVVRIVEMANRSWLVPVAPGTATVTCAASLKYFSSTTTNVVVTVGGPMFADVVLAGCGVLILGLTTVGVMALRTWGKKRKHSLRGVKEK